MDLSTLTPGRSSAEESEQSAVLAPLGKEVSHELNNRLSAVLGHCDLMLLGSELPPDLVTDIEAMRAAAGAAAELLKDFDLWAAPKPPRGADAAALLRKLERPFRYLIGRTGRISIQGQAGLLVPEHNVPALCRLLTAGVGFLRAEVPDAELLDVRGHASWASEPLARGVTFELRCRARADTSSRGQTERGTVSSTAARLTLEHLRSLARPLDGRVRDDRGHDGVALLIDLPAAP
jgi:hypothetical protein